MEYTQMTLDQWVILKDSLKQDIIDAKEKFDGIKRDFVRIGYKLRKIEELKLYEKDGYKTITEFAEAECKLTKTDVSRFISINERYSVGGYSEELREEFLEYGSSKLAEMLTLPDHDMQMIQPEASREGIREVKRFNKTGPEAGEADTIRELIEKFFQDNKETLNTLFADPAMQEYEQNIKHLVEIVNPSGNRTMRKGRFFLMMYESKIMIKQFGEEPQDMQWSEFLRITQEIFGEAAGEDTWEAYFTEEAAPIGNTSAEEAEAETQIKEEKVEEEKEDEERKNRVPGTVNTSNESTGGGREEEESVEGDDRTEEQNKENEGSSQAVSITPTEPENEKIAPAQKVAQAPVRTREEGGSKEPKTKSETAPTNQPEEQIPGQMEVTDYPEILPEPETAFGNRKQYLDTLTEYGAAVYFAECCRTGKMPVDRLLPSAWENWFNQEVDDKGREIESVED
ncbi:MAG: hypothetical protein ACI4F1_08835 [Bariatricus sp.]